MDDFYQPLTDSDKLTSMNYCLMVNGKPYVVDYPEGYILGVKDNMLVTMGTVRERDYWHPHQIKGYYA